MKSIIFNSETRIFYLNGKDVTYAFCINDLGYLEHLYFGSTIGQDDLRLMRMGGATYCFTTTSPPRATPVPSSIGCTA